MRKPTSFSTRIAFAFVGLVLAGILLAEVVWYAGLPGSAFHGAREARLLEATQSLASSANQRVTSLSSAIAQRRGDLLVLAESEKLLSALSRHDPATLQKQLEHHAGQLERAYPAAYRALRVVDPASGTIMASSQRDEIGQPLHIRALLDKASQPGVSELVEDTQGGAGGGLIVIRQLMESDEEGYPVGRLRGVLVAELGVDAMLASGIGNDRDGDRQPGTTLVLSDDDRLLGRAPQGQESGKAFWRVEPQPPGFEGAMQLADGDGEKYLAVYRHIPLSGASSVTLIHYEPVSEALQDLWAQLRGAMWAGVVLALIALVPLLYWARHLTEPLRKLADAADRLGHGDMAARAPIGCAESREIVELATAFNSMADSLENNRRRLEDQVSETTLALNAKQALEASLIQARDFAEAANRAKSSFLSNMSHELRTPLNAVLGFAQLLEMDGNLSEESHAKVAIINRAGLHLLGLIDEVLEISRIESGKSVITHAPFDLKAMLASVEEMIQIRAHAKALSFAVSHDADIPQAVEGDEPHLKQVLINLLGNAVKYTDQGSVTLQVKRRAEMLVFEIADTGPGIEAQEQERIFQPFYQTTEGMAKGEGSGLGLAISLHYARLMGGQLTVSSELGKGSVFTLVVPLLGSELAGEGRQPAAPQLVGVQAGTSDFKVLVVDDNTDNREVVRLFLASACFNVRAVSSGELAILEFERWKPHCICMDMRMPIMDGYEATRRIRHLPRGDEVKIIALTASAFEEDRAAMLEAGCDAVQRKPLEADKLIRLICEQLGLNMPQDTTACS